MKRRLRTDWAKRASAARRHRSEVRSVDERDLGNRACVEAIFAWLDEPRRSFWQKARAWFDRCPY